MTEQSYEKPTVTDLGDVVEETLYFNKKGPKADIYSATVPIVGSVVSV